MANEGLNGAVLPYLQTPQTTTEELIDPAKNQEILRRLKALDKNYGQGNPLLEAQAQGMAAAPVQYDLSPVSALADAFGAKKHIDYGKPAISPEERTMMIAKLAELADQSKEKDIDIFDKFAKSQLVNKTRTGYQNPNTLVPAGVKALDKDFAKEYSSWQTGGKSTTEKAIEQLEQAKAMLKANPNLTGPTIGPVSDKILAFTNPDAIKLRQLGQAGTVATIKSKIGARPPGAIFNAVVAHDFNPYLKGQDNIEKIDTTLNKLYKERNGFENQGNYFRSHGTLAGWLPPQEAPAASGPQKGDVMDGHVFKGGDPGNQANWELVK